MFNVKTTGNRTNIVIEKIKKFDGGLLLRAAKGLAAGLKYAVGIAQRKFLSGPRPTKIQSITGRLRQSISSEVEVTSESVIGKAGSVVPYAARHEYGFKGTEQVRAHTRVIKQVNHVGAPVELRKMVRGRHDIYGNFEDLGYDRTRKEAAKNQKRGLVFIQFVKAHSRKVNYPGKPFMRPAVAEALPVILKRVQSEIATTE